MSEGEIAAVPPRPQRGRSALMPHGTYTDESPARTGPDEVSVVFAGEDGRNRVFSFVSLPLPGLHASLAAALGRRCGPTGTRRTAASSQAVWLPLRQFVIFLATLARPPATMTALRARHLHRFRLHMLDRGNVASARQTVTVVLSLLADVHAHEGLHPEVVEVLAQRNYAPAGRRAEGGRPGYSDREFASIMRAARCDVAVIRRRVARGEALLRLAHNHPERVDPAHRERAQRLIVIAETGTVPRTLMTGDTRNPQIARPAEARQLFLTWPDITALVVLGVGLTGRNSETIKELPAEHRVLEQRAVAVNLTKRRRGKAHSRDTVHWERNDRASRQLHTPGNFYLLLHQLTRRSRTFSTTVSIWSVWCDTGRPGKGNPTEAFGHRDPFGRNLSEGLYFPRWARRHGLVDDGGAPLEISMNRLRTTLEVRTTRTVGGHLPSSVRTNTMDVSFLHYLRNDPHIQDWAARILDCALADAESHARDVVVRVLDPVAARGFATAPETTATAMATTRATLEQAAAGELDTVLTSCLDITASPHNDGACAASFELCLRCPNALILHRHLPMLLAYLDVLQSRLDAMDVETWCRDHGPNWLIITRLVLPRFTSAQLAQAARDKPPSLPWALLEGPAEQP